MTMTEAEQLKKKRRRTTEIDSSLQQSEEQGEGGESSRASRDGKTKKKKTKKKSGLVLPPLGKFLASSDKLVRDKAVAALTKFLSGGASRRRAVDVDVDADGSDEVERVDETVDWTVEWVPEERLSKDEMSRLWKGVFYCFWMSDKPLVQQALANELALLTLSVRGRKGSNNDRIETFKSALCYLDGFWETLVREWSGIDRLRRDKFYLLVRRFVHVGFLLLKRERWDEGAVRLYSDLLTRPGGPLDVKNDKVPSAILYHVADVYLEELSRSIESPLSDVSSEKEKEYDPSPSRSRPLPLPVVIEPWCSVLERGNKVAFDKVDQVVFTPLLASLLGPVSLDSRPRSSSKKRRKEDNGGLGLDEIVEACGGEKERGSLGERVLDRVWESAASSQEDVGRRRMYELVAKWRAHE